MNTDYALFVLKEEKRKLDDKILDMNLLEDEGEKISERKRTKYKHRAASLDFSIEVLETYQD